MMIRDKSSYIYDYSYSQVRSVSKIFENELSKIFETVDEINQKKGPIQFNSKLKYNYFGYTKSSMMDAHIFKNVNDAETRRLNKKIQENLNKLKSKYYFTMDDETLEYVLLIKLFNNDIFFATNKFKTSPFEGISREFQFILYSNTGEIIHTFPESNYEKLPILNKKQLDDFQNKDFSTGVKEFEINKINYLIGYQKIFDDQFIMTSMINKNIAFIAVKDLIAKSFTMGLSIFLLALGDTILLIRGLIRKINQLVKATDLISQGDFTHKIDVSDKDKDEVSKLSKSFNIMSGKVQNLLTEVADKARMEQELETASIVQSRLLPNKPFTDNKISVQGKSISASECGGDWWNYGKINDLIIVIMGDVTGHGASAALVTAALFGTFSRFIEEFSEKFQMEHPQNIANQILIPLTKSLNSTVLASGEENVSFPCLLTCIDQKQAKAFIINAGHPGPVKFNRSKNAFEMISGPMSLPLGQKNEFKVECFEVPLNDKDQILWYTDGLFDQRKTDGKKLKKKEVFDRIQQLISNSQNDLSTEVMQIAVEFFGADIKNRPDDITIVGINYL